MQLLTKNSGHVEQLTKTSNRNKNSQYFQKPIKQPLEQSGDEILTSCLPTGGKIQPVKKGPRG